MNKTIIYIGNDDVFFQELKTNALALMKNCEVLSVHPAPRELLAESTQKQPSLVIVDIQSSSCLAEEVRSLKGLPHTRSALVAVLCHDEQDAHDKGHLLAAGVNLFHFKGIEDETFFKDCFFMAFGIGSKFRPFAQAQNLEIKLSMEMAASMGTIGPSSFKLECDINFDGEIRMKLPFLPEHPTCEFKIRSVFDCRNADHFLKTYVVDFPFPGPWEEITTQSIQPETISTWLDFHQQYFEPLKNNVVVFNSRLSFLREQLNFNLPCRVHYRVPEEDLHPLLDLKRPTVIFFELAEDCENNLLLLEKIVAEVRSIPGYSPLLVVFNSASESEALKKVLNYQQILSVSQPMNTTMFKEMINKASSKFASEEEKYLKADDDFRVVYLPIDIILTSMTEHEITFLSEKEIPFFAVSRMSLPQDMFLTIVPPLLNKKPGSELFHYQAYIHGAGEETLMRLRKIINQMIYKPVNTMTIDSVQQILKQDYMDKNPLPGAEGSDGSSSDSSPNEELSETEYLEVRTMKQGKSKL